MKLEPILIPKIHFERFFYKNIIDLFMFGSAHVLYICAIYVNIIDRFSSSLVQTVLSLKAWTNSLAKTIQLIDLRLVERRGSPNIVV